MKPNNGLCFGDVKELLSYNPESGVLTWISQGSAYGKVRGKVAGTIRKDKSLNVKIYGANYLAHRIAWLLHFGNLPETEIDHIDGDPSNNRISNLRVASREQNAMNRAKQSNNKSGYKGVRFLHKLGKWVAEISANKSHYHLGLYDSAEDASDAYTKAAHELHGDFCNVK